MPLWLITGCVWISRAEVDERWAAMGESGPTLPTVSPPTADTGPSQGPTGSDTGTVGTGDTGTVGTGDTGAIPPAVVADAGPDQQIVLGNPVLLDGSASFDPDGGALTYVWSFGGRPAASSLDETDLDPWWGAVRPGFTPDVVGTWVLSLTVYDDEGDQAQDAVVIEVVTL